ncbi:MAG: GNAT family N-acetyltransferase, partial [Trebonia sp.]
MRIEPWSSGDPALTRGYLQLLRAARAADDPLGPPVSERQLRYGLERSAMPMEAWFVPGPAAGDVQAWCHLGFPDRQNLDLADTNIVVHPAARRHGTGGELLRHAAHRVAARGRRVLSAWVREGGAGEAFARKTGAAASGLTGVRRVQHLAGLPAGRVSALRATAAAAAAGYSLETWTGLVPGDRIDQVASVHNALRDAPHGENYEPTIWDAERIQTLINAEIAGLRCRAY